MFVKTASIARTVRRTVGHAVFVSEGQGISIAVLSTKALKEQQPMNLKLDYLVTIEGNEALPERFVEALNAGTCTMSFGPIYSIRAIYSNANGGKEVTQEVLNAMNAASH